MPKCKACGADIVFIPTYGGKKIPCDANPVLYWADRRGKDKIVTPNGEVFSCRLKGSPDQPTGVGYISHFATCPAADSFRKGERRI